MTQETPELQINASHADELVTTRMVTKYGPISFSYAPKEIDLGISNFVSALLRGAADPILASVCPGVSESTGTLLRKSAEIYSQQEGKKFPRDAIEEFSETARGYSQGTVEQFMDILPGAISLMMDYVAIAALTLVQTNEGNQAKWSVEERCQMLRNIIRDQFSDASDLPSDS